MNEGCNVLQCTILTDRRFAYILQSLLNYYSCQMTSNFLYPTNLHTLTKHLKVLAEPKRLQIFHLLMEGVHCNCELSESLQMAPNLISHHLRVLRDAELVKVEHDNIDARWVYYSIDKETLTELNKAFTVFFDPNRIKPRLPTCGPQGDFINFEEIAVKT